MKKKGLYVVLYTELQDIIINLILQKQILSEQDLMIGVSYSV